MFIYPRFLSPNQLHILTLAREIAFLKGQRIYLVGGTIRDLLLSRTDVDLDLAVEGDGIIFARELARQLGGRLLIHERFLTATVYWNGERVDMATCRQDHYPEPGGLPEVKPANLMVDLARRDFSVNAMALPLTYGDGDRIIDPYNGRQDLTNSLLRVLYPMSFIDDPSRILRGVRLATRLKFQFEGETKILMRQALSQGLLDRFEEKRFWQEFALILKEQPAAIWAGLIELGWQGFPGHGMPDINACRRAEKLLYQWKLRGRRRIDAPLVYFLIATMKFSTAALDKILEGLNWGRKRRRLIINARAQWKTLTPVLFWQALLELSPAEPQLTPEAMIFMLAMGGRSKLPAWVLN